MMQVLKFGGSSVADATRISAVLDIVTEAESRGRVVLVCSAVSGCTDALIKTGACTDPEEKRLLLEGLRARHAAIVRRLFTGAEREEALSDIDSVFAELANARPEDCVCYGELLSTRIIARKCLCEGISTRWIDSRALIRCMAGKVVELSLIHISEPTRPY